MTITVNEYKLERFLFNASFYEVEISKCKSCGEEDTDGYSFYFNGGKYLFCDIECLRKFFIKNISEGCE